MRPGTSFEWQHNARMQPDGTITQGTTVYASWNGATRVASWRVLAGPSAAALTPVGQCHDASFETAMTFTSAQPYFEVQALDAAGGVLGTSRVVPR